LTIGERLDCQVRIRYRQADQACTIYQQSGGRITVVFEERQRAVAPGQFAVFYDGDRCLGGAIIDHAYSRPAALLAAI
jgi:tRNA-specific 2-thiouridylase